MLRPRHESPTPLMRLVLPSLVLAPFIVAWLFSLDHPWAAIGLAVLVLALLSGLMLATRRWLHASVAAIGVAAVAWIAAFVWYLLLHPPN